MILDWWAGLRVLSYCQAEQNNTNCFTVNVQLYITNKIEAHRAACHAGYEAYK